MQIEVLKSKIHRVKVTGADLDYIGSITMTRRFRSRRMIEGEKVSIVNVSITRRLDITSSKGNAIRSYRVSTRGPMAAKGQI